MDPLTHIVAGATIGELVLGKKIGNKALILGAIAGDFPDIDVILTTYLHDDLQEIIIHRSYTHALLTDFVMAGVMGLITYFSFRKKVEFKSWYWFWALGMLSHSLLDSFTTYGTQLLLPFSNYRVGFNNLSIIDPLYTLPFLALLIIALRFKRDHPKRKTWLMRALYLSTAYLCLTFGAKYYVHQKFTQELEDQHIPYTTLSTSPTILNNILWAGIAYNDTTLLVGEYAILQKHPVIEFVKYQRNLQLEESFRSKELEIMKWFSQGKYFLEQKDANTLRMYIVKWGRSDFNKSNPQEAFIFYYELTKGEHGMTVKAVRPDMSKLDFKLALGQLWERIINY